MAQKNFIIFLCYKEINNVKKVFQNATINLEKSIKTEKGLKYSRDINFSFQGNNSKYSIYEVISQCIINNLIFNIEIELSDRKNINLSSNL